MAYVITGSINVRWVPDGAGPMTVPSAQELKLMIGVGAAIQVPGGDSPTQGNFNTAIGGSSSTATAPSVAAALEALIAANLGQIQGFSTGGG
jgi:hypothetical protein